MAASRISMVALLRGRGHGPDDFKATLQIVFAHGLEPQLAPGLFFSLMHVTPLMLSVVSPNSTAFGGPAAGRWKADLRATRKCLYRVV